MKDLDIAFFADNFWGLAALLWIVTGLLRAFGGYAKETSYYLDNIFFWLKMGLLVLVFLLEIWPMITLIRWRVQMRRGILEPKHTKLVGFISYLEAVIVVAMLFAATAMSRGLDF